jgi:UDP-GlcNAc:undecaprenyl-phosphate GlcNAc-1-phosphate transferase
MSFLICLVLSLMLTPVARMLGLRLGIVDSPEPGPLKIHQTPVSLLGGVAVVAAALGGLALSGGWLPGIVVAAGILALGTGLLDDARPLPAVVRVGFLSLVGALLAGGGFLAGFPEPLAFAGTVLLVLACANGVNIVDGQDGLAGGLAAIAAAGLAALAALSGRAEAAALGLALAAALAGFLVWNRPPARIFLGNGGSYAVGTLLAAQAVVVIEADGWRGLLAAGVCLGVFAFEVAFTVARRALRGDPLAAGDRLHSYDVLVSLGARREAVTLAFWTFGALAGAVALFVGRIPLLGAWVTALAAAGSAVAAGTGLWARGIAPLRKSR